MELFMEVACCAGYMAENKLPQNHILGWKTPVVVVLGLTMAKVAVAPRSQGNGMSSSSWSTQTQQCCSCISSCYSTFFNITLFQFPSGDGPWVAFHRGVLLGRAALWLLAFPFTTGKSYSRHLLAVCRRSPTSYQAVTPGQLQSCKHFESAWLHSEGDGPGKAGAASPPSSTAAPTGTTSGHPQLFSHQRLRRLPGSTT